MILISAGGAPGVLWTPEISQRISAAGHEVEVFLEPEAKRFVGRAAFADPVLVVSEPPRLPDAILFAPATTATLARLAHGLGDHPPEELHAGGTRPAFVAPGLDRASARHPAVLENLRLLREDGCVVLGEGGAFASAAEVADGVLGGLGGPLSGLRVVVTAGGTREPIDSVRFIGNRSSGKMGLAVAREARRMGAEVVVVAANVGDVVESGIEVHRVETVDELREATLRAVAEAGALVMAAAVSDFKPARKAEAKIRRHDGLVLEMVATEDVLKEVRRRNPGLFMIGFAASHGDPRPDAREKLRSKRADLIVGNDISRSGLGFEADENEVHIVGEGAERFVPRATKTEVARAILDSMTLGIQEGRGG